MKGGCIRVRKANLEVAYSVGSNILVMGGEL